MASCCGNVGRRPCLPGQRKPGGIKVGGNAKGVIGVAWGGDVRALGIAEGVLDAGLGVEPVGALPGTEELSRGVDPTDPAYALADTQLHRRILGGIAVKF